MWMPRWRGPAVLGSFMRQRLPPLRARALSCSMFSPRCPCLGGIWGVMAYPNNRPPFEGPCCYCGCSRGPRRGGRYCECAEYLTRFWAEHTTPRRCLLEQCARAACRRSVRGSYLGSLAGCLVQTPAGWRSALAPCLSLCSPLSPCRVIIMALVVFA